ncbi:MAG: ATP-binding cassette domain-containing protein [Ruminococcaceae bacterium]|nr:ATP-binding cassette domain-containing protein [Oscillospiraceae bacterium]
MLLINKTLLDMSKGLRRYIFLIAALKVVVLAATARFAQTISSFMGNMFEPVMTSTDFRAAVLAALGASAVMLVGEVLVGEVEYRCTAKSRLLLRERIFSKMLELDVGNIEKIGASAAVANAVDGVEQMQVYYSKYLPGLLYCFLAPIYLFFRLKSISMPVATLLLVVSILLMPLNNRFRSVIDALKKEYWVSFRSLTAYYLESLRSLTTIKLFNQDDRRYATLREKADDFRSRIMDVMKVNFSAFLFTETVIYSTVVASAVIVCRQMVRGQVTLSQALMVLMLSYSFFSAMRALMNATHSALTGIAAAQNIAETLDIDTTRPYKPALEKKGSFEGVTFDDVTFSYDGRKDVLKDLDMTFEKGRMTAIVGRSGCGKSTVAALLMRFSDPGKGSIDLEGTEYVSMKPEELRRNIAMVPQAVSIFSGTIEDNLRIADPDASEERLMDALDRVRLKEWVLAQPAGLKTDVGDGGARLSGGQRQKIGIARALLSDAPYIIFDEATSSVDVESEGEIWACIGELAPKRTPIVISHRLSTIARADKIYVIQDGRSAESGNHAELMAQNGLYSRLVREQDELERHGERRLAHA